MINQLIFLWVFFLNNMELYKWGVPCRRLHRQYFYFKLCWQSVSALWRPLHRALSTQLQNAKDSFRQKPGSETEKKHTITMYFFSIEMIFSLHLFSWVKKFLSLKLVKQKGRFLSLHVFEDFCISLNLHEKMQKKNV